jgi:hypothetical protein
VVEALASTRTATVGGKSAGAWSAGIALALVLPLLGASRRARGARWSLANTGTGSGMKKKPCIKSIENLTADEARAYIAFCDGDDLNAAWMLASDRNRLDGSPAAPDDAEVHHALFLLCRARGLEAPSFDEMRVRLRARVAA